MSLVALGPLIQVSALLRAAGLDPLRAYAGAAR
jgi:hypothetical protein